MFAWGGGGGGAAKCLATAADGLESRASPEKADELGGGGGDSATFFFDLNNFPTIYHNGVGVSWT